jgi:hypothetical protein
MGSYSYKKHKKSKHSKHSKKNKHHSRRKTRKMGGGSANMPCAGCRSDDTIKISRYYLNTPLPDGRGGGGGQMGGGGQACTQSPYQFSNGKQMGGRKGRGRGKMVPHKRGMRGMKGGDGSFWNFAKFWNPNTGGNILSLSDKGTSPTGLGAPLTTSGDKPIPPIQPWPAQKLVMPHVYTQGGAQMSGGGGGGGDFRGGVYGGGRRGVNHTRKGKGKGRGRGLRGGSILDDIQNIGRSIVYGAGSAINGLSGYSNKIYNANPSPTVQFPRGLGDVSKGGVAYSSLELPVIYKNSYATAATY